MFRTWHVTSSSEHFKEKVADVLKAIFFLKNMSRNSLATFAFYKKFCNNSLS
jgi:hypothetical protein